MCTVDGVATPKIDLLQYCLAWKHGHLVAAVLSRAQLCNYSTENMVSIILFVWPTLPLFCQTACENCVSGPQHPSLDSCQPPPSATTTTTTSEAPPPPPSSTTPATTPRKRMAALLLDNEVRLQVQWRESDTRFSTLICFFYQSINPMWALKKRFI